MKYKYKREGNHFKVTSKSSQTVKPEIDEIKKPNFSFGGILSYMGYLLSSILYFIIEFPIMFLRFLKYWIIDSILLSIFWVLIYSAYRSFILNSGEYRNPFTSGWPLLVVMVIAFLRAIIRVRQGYNDN